MSRPHGSARLEERYWCFVSAAIALPVLAAVLLSFHFPWQQPLFPNADFEMGTLAHWTAEGEAFLAQPTYGDNPLFRSRSTSNLQGRYWIGTFERRQAADDPPGAVRGDAPVGRLVSEAFTIRRNRIVFLIGGGNGSAATGVALEVDGQRVLFEPGHAVSTDSEKMSRVVWDVSRWKGRQAVIVIDDADRGPWGHVNCDDFRYG